MKKGSLFREWVKSMGGREALAAKLGVTSNAVRRWESGQGSPTARNIHRLIELSGGHLEYYDIVGATMRNERLNSRKSA